MPIIILIILTVIAIGFAYSSQPIAEYRYSSILKKRQEATKNESINNPVLYKDVSHITGYDDCTVFVKKKGWNVSGEYCVLRVIGAERPRLYVKERVSWFIESTCNQPAEAETMDWSFFKDGGSIDMCDGQ